MGNGVVHVGQEVTVLVVHGDAAPTGEFQPFLAELVDVIPLTVPETGRLLARPPRQRRALAGLTASPHARSRWYHKRTRLAPATETALVS